MNKVTIAFFLFFSCIGKGFASTLTKDTVFPLISFNHYGENEELASKTIYSIIQDSDGFIWMGTDAGAFRYDGKHFKRFTLDDGLSDNEVLQVYQDRHGRIWFMTFNGHLSYYKDGKIYNPGNTPFLKMAYTGGSILSAFENKKGKLWFGTMTSAFIVINNDSVELVEPSDKSNTIRSVLIHEDLKGKMWSFKGNTMYDFFKPRSPDSILLHSTISPLKGCYNKNKSETYFCSTDGNIIKLYDQSHSIHIDKSDAPSYMTLNNIFSDGDNLWFCTRGAGCDEYQNGKFVKKYFNTSSVTTVYRDREGNLWFGTLGEGAYMLPAKGDLTESFNQSTGLSFDKITSIAYGINRSLWLGYSNGIIDKITAGKKKTFYKTTPLEGTTFRITSLLSDSDIVWCGTDLGIYYIQNDVMKYIYRDEKIGDFGPYSIKQIVKGRRNKFFATFSFNLLEIFQENDKYYLKACFDSITRTFSIAENDKNTFIVSGMEGLMEYIPGIKSGAFPTDVDFSSTRVLDVKTDADNLLLLATNGNGLYILKDGKLLQHFKKSTGLSDNNCKRLCISGNQLYVATDYGLNIFEKNNNKWDIAEIITTKNNLLSNSVNDVTVGHQAIYVATDKGLSILSRERIVSPAFTSNVIITEIITDSVKNVSGNNYNFRSDIPRLLIRFAYPVFNLANSSEIKYRLLKNKNEKSEWITSASNEVEFSSLNPGDYIFQLKPDTKNSGDERITNLYFRIMPMWWQTAAAKVFFSGCFISLLVFIIRRRARMKYEVELKQLSLIEAERSRIASDMHDDIGADLTQIRLWSYIQKNATNKSEEMIEKIASTSDEVLQKMDQIVWALDTVHDHSGDLISFICEYAIEYLETTDIKVSFDVEDGIPDVKLTAIQKRNIFLVIKELLHNTIKHSGATNLSLKVYFAENKLNLIYSDNGKGFDQSLATDGLGQTTIQKRMSEINSSINIKTEAGHGFIAHLAIDLKK